MNFKVETLLELIFKQLKRRKVPLFRFPDLMSVIDFLPALFFQQDQIFLSKYFNHQVV